MILIITPFIHPNIGGVEQHLNDYLNYLKKKKKAVFVLSYQPLVSKLKTVVKEKTGKIIIYRFPYLRFNLFYRLEKYPLIQFGYLFFGLFIYSLFFMIANHRQIKVIHGHGLAAGLISGLLGKIFHKKSVISLHTIYRFSERNDYFKVPKLILNLNSYILAISNQCRQDLINLGINHKKVEVYSYWVDLKTFKPRPMIFSRKKLILNRKKFISLFVGRFIKDKLLIEALKVAQLMPENDFLFIGQGPLESEIKNASLKFPNIKLIGPKLSSQISYYYNAANLFLFGSVDRDYFAKVSMEAMACGLPIIVAKKSNYFGKPSKIDKKILNSETCFYVDLEPTKTVKMIDDLKKNRKKLITIKKKCHEYALKSFSERNAEKIWCIYSS